jgi:hypothetical protein
MHCFRDSWERRELILAWWADFTRAWCGVETDTPLSFSLDLATPQAKCGLGADGVILSLPLPGEGFDVEIGVYTADVAQGRVILRLSAGACRKMLRL